ncbi:hypothetical protein K4L44_10490 [Halosquirtibacter laminarini]|uniref:Uncharacterized protein n=1 Tax=Halosquirtibacter laminarini TaxID=3374600 RepID=A0AC61NBY9_9BACT|nr:hypothetical protein K4L44_10490 [Prolixibacteraceae bacterium]
MRLLRSTILFLAILLCTVTYAQEGTTTATSSTTQTTKKATIRKPRPKFTLKDKSIDEQFDLIYKRSTKYQDYKVVKITWYNDLRKNIKDSISAQVQMWKEANTETIKLKSEVETLNNQLNTTKTNLDNVTNEKDSLTFMGMLIKKSTYQTILWSIIFLLVVFSIICFLLYKRAHVVTKRTQEKLEDTQKEFDLHRKRALEKEQVLARKLLTEQKKNQSF